MEGTNFIGETAQRFAEGINEQVAIKIVEVIDEVIDLKNIIAEDLKMRQLDFDIAKESCKDEEIRSMMQEPTIEFKDITQKLEYAFKALLSKGYTFTHDINMGGVLSIKFFKIEKEFKYEVSTTFKSEIKDIIKDNK